MIIGVISDIHKRFTPQAFEALEGVDHIICAGDIEDPTILIELECIAPTTCVMGNCDRFYDANVPFKTEVTLEGVTFLVVHRPEDIGVLDPSIQVVVHGHTHVPRNQMLYGVRFINPGSPSKPRGGSNKSVAKIYIENNSVQNVGFIEV